jgi:hypothetical protein
MGKPGAAGIGGEFSRRILTSFGRRTAMGKERTGESLRAFTAHVNSTAPGSVNGGTTGPDLQTAIMGPAMAPSDEPFERGEVSEPAADDASEPQVSEMSDSDRAWLDDQKKSELLQRARDLGSKDGQGGAASHAGEIQHWPKVVERMGTAEGGAFVGALLKSYDEGFRDARKAPFRKAIADKLHLPSYGNTEAYFQEAEKSDNLESMQAWGFREALLGSNLHPKRGEKFGGPVTDAGVAAYELGYETGAKALPRLQELASQLGYSDGRAHAVPGSRKEIEELAGPRGSLINAYDKAYGKGEVETVALNPNQQTQPPHVDSGPGKWRAPKEIDEDRKWEEFQKVRQELLEEWNEELRHHAIE